MVIVVIEGVVIVVIEGVVILSFLMPFLVGFLTILSFFDVLPLFYDKSVFYHCFMTNPCLSPCFKRCFRLFKTRYFGVFDCLKPAV